MTEQLQIKNKLEIIFRNTTKVDSCLECDGGEWAFDIAKEAIGEKVGE